MVFNVLSNNTDDHAKNFSFIMDRNGSWRISPAYDLCFIMKTPAAAEKYHAFSVRGKHEDIMVEDLIAFAVQNDIKNPEKYIEKVRGVLHEAPALAAKNGVAPLFVNLIQSRLEELSPGMRSCSKQ